jgi:hypothetical protein
MAGLQFLDPIQFTFSGGILSARFFEAFPFRESVLSCPVVTSVAYNPPDT